MAWIDTHTHLFEDRFASDLPQVISRAIEAGIEHCFCIGIDRSTSEQSIALANRFPMVRAVVGIQPNHAAETEAGDWERIVELARDPQVVAIGESGLDRYWKDRSPFDIQQAHFDRHLTLAREMDLPIIIHNREADADIAEALHRHFDIHGPIRGVMHSFSSPDAKFAEDCLAMGLHLSFAGMLTYSSAKELREVAKLVPLDRLLVETDCPYLAPIPKRGQRNEPAHVVYTGAQLAQLHGMTSDAMAEQTRANTRELFRLE